MDIASVTFALFVVAGLMVWHVAGPTRRAWTFAALNAVFLASFPSAPSAVLPILVFAALGWGLLHLVARLDWDGTLPIGIVATVAVFAVLKKYSLLGGFAPIAFAYTTVGLSYILFRVLHLAIDLRRGDLKTVPGPLAYFNFLFCFLTFIAGPVQRYQDHAATLAEPACDLDAAEIRSALLRILEGLLKIVVVAAIASDVADSLPLSFTGAPDLALSPLRHLPGAVQALFQGQDGTSIIRTASRLLLHAAAFVVYLTVDFVGYMDIVVGTGRLFGLSLPENFDRPFAAANFLEFWTRWHMTLSNWFKRYVFNPLMMALARRWGRRKAWPFLVVAAFFVTFLLMGLWHGTTAATWVYGVLLAGGIGLNQLYQTFVYRPLGNKRAAALRANPLYAALSRGTMAAFFTLAVACLWLDGGQLAQCARAFGAGGLIRLLVLASLLAAIILALWDGAASLAAKAAGPLAALAFYGGFIAVAAIWGNFFNASNWVAAALGIGLPDPVKAAFGGVLVLFAWEVGRRAGPVQAPTRAALAARFLLLLFVGLSHAGAAPEFVYKGY